MINEDHFQSAAIQARLDELHRLWELLLMKLSEKGIRLQQALVITFLFNPFNHYLDALVELALNMELELKANRP